MPNRRQAITWNNADPVHRRIYAALGGDDLIHQGQDKMGTILQMTFSNAFSWRKMFIFWFEFHLSLFKEVNLTKKSLLVHIRACCHQATSYHLNHLLTMIHDAIYIHSHQATNHHLNHLLTMIRDAIYIHSHQATNHHLNHLLTMICDAIYIFIVIRQQAITWTICWQ